ncbi:MAG: efflux RND transporter permease subunit [Planctomycetes bacterium]|nr:efflux RND transporter permease subunit [Planctomycetota bacterium]
MGLIKFSLKNPYTVAVMALAITILGTLAMSSIPVDILPVFKAPAVQVMTFYQGMPTSSVEKTITNRIERWTNQATGCEKIESKSMQGVSVARLFFRDDIDPAAALTQVNSLALGTLPTLPPNTLPPVVLPFDPTGTLPLGILSVRGKYLDETKLQDLARINIRNMLGAVPGTVAPAVFGGKQRTILVYVNPNKLEARGLSPKDIVDALGRSNFMVTPGVARFGAYEFQLDSNAMVKTVAELNDIPIHLEPGKSIYLRDVGSAVDAAAIQTGLVRIDGQRQVYVPIYRQQGASSLAVIDGVKGHIPFMKERLPKGIELDVVMDQSEYVRQAIHALLHEGVVGAILVAAMIVLFLGNLRMTGIALLSMPLAILCSLIGLQATGNTLNAMTLGGLALAIGPLVDNAIVVLENTHRHLTLGKKPLKAAFDGAGEVSLPVLVATLTTIIVLCPIALMPGMGGFLFRPLTLALAFAMIGSFVLSQTLVPVLCGKVLHAHADQAQHAGRSWLGVLLARFERFLGWATGRYQAILAWALARRGRVLGMAGGLFAAALGLLFFIGQEFFPQVDAGQLTIYLRAPSGTNLESMEHRVARVEHFLHDHIPANERRMIIAELGLVPDWSSAYTANSGSQDAVIKLQLTDERTLSAQEYAAKLRYLFARDPKYLKDFADLRVSFDTGGMISAALNFGASSPIDIRVEGGTAARAMRLAQMIREKVRTIPGTADVYIKQRLDAPQRIIVVNRLKAADVRLSERDVMTQVVTAMNSSVSVSRNFWIDQKTGNQYYVAVQYPEDRNMVLQDVLNIVATGTRAAYPVKLGDLVRLEYGTAPVEVNHVALARVFDILVATEDRDIGSVAQDVERSLSDIRVELKKSVQRLEAECQNLRQKRTDKSAAGELTQRELELAEARSLTGLRVSLSGEYGRMR